jgi:hypothetical protein
MSRGWWRAIPARANGSARPFWTGCALHKALASPAASAYAKGP